MASSLTILVLSLHWVYSQAETPDPTYEPTTEPTFEPTFEPTIEPISSDTETSFPTTTPPSVSFVEVKCLEKNESISKNNIVLSEANGFNDNKYGKPSKTSLVIDDAWNITDINVPLTNKCYLHFYLSNNDLWGYRSNATCTLAFNINKNDENININDSSLNLYNILDINQKYNTFWSLKAMNKTAYVFASNPACQHLDGGQNIQFSNENVKKFVLNPDFENIDKNTGEILISNNGLFPYYFYLASNQNQNDSQFRIIPAVPSSVGQTCTYDQALPTYNTENKTKIGKGGIDYYLFVNSTHQFSTNITVNIEIKQICPGVIQPTMVETTGEPFEKDNDDTITLTLAILILLFFAACFILMAIANLFIYCFCAEREEYENETQIQMEQLNNDEMMETLGIEHEEKNNMDETTERTRFMVSEEDHQEMLQVLRKGSMSIGLE